MKLDLRDGVAVITGAASGIGRATALELAGRGCHLALVDRQEEGLRTVAAQAEARGVRVSSHLMDVTDTRAVDSLPSAVLAEHGKVTVLMNNAGVSLVGTFEELTIEEFRWLIEINFLSVVALTKAFLPTLKSAGQAQIANVSSLFGIIAPAEQSAYAASKFAVRGFSESLRHELDGSGVGVTVIHPGGVRTSIASSARIARAAEQRAAREATDSFAQHLLTLPPERAAEEIVKAIERRRPRVLIGNDARTAELIQRIAPARYWAVFRRRLERLGRRVTAASG